MRIPFPVKIPLWYVIVFAVCLCSVELLQGTAPLFVGCVFFYVIISAMAFNVAGGLATPSGAYIFFMVVLTLLVGLVVKAVYWEAADSNLKSPDLTIRVYLTTSVSLLLAAYLSQKFRRKPAYLDHLLTPGNLYHVTVGCLAASIVIPPLISYIGAGAGSVGGALYRFNQFGPLAVLLATYHVIRTSGGRRSANTVVLIGIGYTFVTGGLLEYSKEGLFAGIVAWLLVCAAMKYEFSAGQMAVLLVAIMLMGYYLVPYAQVGRVDRGSDSRVDTAIKNLGRLEEMRLKNEADSAGYASESAAAPHYYSKPSTFLERLQMVAMDDALITVTEQEGEVGYYPIYTYFANLVPHFLWANKPSTTWGNTYAHRIGMLAEDDDSTGVSFSPIGEAWVIGRWVGITLLASSIWIMSFIIMDSIAGSVLTSPWGFYFTLLSAHIAPEGMLGGVMGLSLYFGPLLVAVVYVSVYLMPIVGTLFTPSKRTFVPFNSTRPPAAAQRRTA